MKFSDMIIAIEAETAELESTLNDCSNFAEASYNEYLINLKEAELKIVQENGTQEDYLYLEKGASEGFIVRSINAIKKMIEAIKKWVKSICDKMASFINEKKTEAALKRLEDAAKKDPKLKGKKIEVPDIDKQEKFLDKFEAKIDRKLTILNSRKFNTEADKKELNEIEESFYTERTAIIAATVAVTVGVAIGAMIHHVKNAPKKLNVDDIKKPSTPNVVDDKNDTNDTPKKRIDDVKIDIKETDTPEDMENLIHAYQIRTAIIKERGNAIQKFVRDTFRTLKEVVTKSGEISPDGILDTKKESVDDVAGVETIDVKEVKENTMEDLDAMLDQIIEEASNTETTTDSTEEFNADAYLESIETELFGDDETPFEESASVIDDDDIECVSAEEYLESLEAELFGEDDDVVEESAYDDGITHEEFLEALESELFGDEEGMTHEEYLESLEAELFGEDEDTVEESTTYEDYLDDMETDLFGEQ